MSDICLEINKVKNIQYAKVTLPLEGGLYVLVGENACGKSTLMLSLSLMVKTSSSHMLVDADICEDSFIDIQVDETNDHWFYKKGKLTTGKSAPAPWVRSAAICRILTQKLYTGKIGIILNGWTLFIKTMLMKSAKQFDVKGIKTLVAAGKMLPGRDF
jgi:ABC-type cobalamin/Fe3+-siderophores transport system ATPase subunit